MPQTRASLTSKMLLKNHTVKSPRNGPGYPSNLFKHIGTGKTLSQLSMVLYLALNVNNYPKIFDILSSLLSLVSAHSLSSEDWMLLVSVSFSFLSTNRDD